MIILIALAALGAMLCLGLAHDWLSWNGGRCACGHHWRYFDTDSQGGRGYTCPGPRGASCHKTIWISYPVDRDSGAAQ